MSGEVSVRGGGHGQPTLLLLHGLGATGAVWSRWAPLLEQRWPGRWLAPDLPGHGASGWLERYSFGEVAAALAALADRDEPSVVVGHSYGGVIGLTLASGWFGHRVDAVIGLGIKVSWLPDEVARAQALADRPVKWFGSRGEAAARFLRVSGLDGLCGEGDVEVASGLREEGGQWRLAMDPLTWAPGVPDLPGLLCAARAKVLLARGEHDDLVTGEELTQLCDATATLPGLGHNAHVEDPTAVLELALREITAFRADR
jgi:pimeloyl-ACP methyl ester carboxylesterase